MMRCIACGDALHYPHHARRGYCEHSYCEGFADAQVDAPSHHAAVAGCTGTGELWRVFGTDPDDPTGCTADEAVWARGVGAS